MSAGIVIGRVDQQSRNALALQRFIHACVMDVLKRIVQNLVIQFTFDLFVIGDIHPALLWGTVFNLTTHTLLLVFTGRLRVQYHRADTRIGKQFQ